MSGSRRRLAAVVFTDIAGYTSMTQRDESSALRLLEEHRTIIRTSIVRNGGTEVKTMGDAFLIRFDSALDAMNCSLDIQRSFHERNLGLSAETEVMVRVGIHLGDVVGSGDDILGDTLNIASRIEPLAESGGICVSRPVYEQVRNKISLQFASLGLRELKNIEEKLEVFRVILPWENEKRSSGTLDPKRLAVLPFVNISPDPSDEYFADGLTEEMIARLSWISGLEVIARTSVIAYKGKGTTARQIGTELRAGTLLEGSVRKAGERIRVTVQLIDSNTEAHLWSEAYDRNLVDIFAVQVEVAETVAKRLMVRLLPPERKDIEKSPTADVNAYTLYMKGRMIWSEQTQSAFLKAIEYFQKAIELDPNFALAYAGLADCHSLLGDIGYTRQAEAISLTESAALKAVELDPRLPEAHVSLAPTRYHRYDFDGADDELRKAIELKPNYALAHAWRGVTLRIRGRFDEALIEFERAVELDPSSPHMNSYVANTLRIMGRYEESFQRVHRILELSPSSLRAREILGYLYIQRGMYAEGLKELKTVAETEIEDHALSTLGFGYAIAGQVTEARGIIRTLESRSRERYVGSDHIAVIYLMLDEREKAYALLSKAIDELCSSWIATLGYSPFFDRFRKDEQFIGLLKRIGLVPKAR